MTDKVETKLLGGEEKIQEKKQFQGISVTLGLGHGKKKKRYVQAFYNALWPVLKDEGWTLVNGRGDEEGAIYFLPPGVSMGKKPEGQEDSLESTSKDDQAAPGDKGTWDCASCGRTNLGAKSRCAGVSGEGHCIAWRGKKRLRYFRRIRDVIERVLERENEVEAKAADAFSELIPEALEIFVERKNDKKGEPSPSFKVKQDISPQNQQHIEGPSWKYERTHYEKASSRVGPEFQVDALPAAGSHTSTESDAFDGGSLYEQMWDTQEADKVGKLNFVSRVNSAKREPAYNLLHLRGYRLPGFYNEVCNASPTDCSEWTKADGDNFRSAVFEHHEDMKAVSKMLDKPLGQCINYYLVKFKCSKSYKSLKRSMKRKANITEGSTGVLVCNECGKGGMLIACDTCEAHYHLTCATPPLHSIPDGTWNCVNCKRETRSMLSSQDEMSCGTHQKQTQGLAESSVLDQGDATLKGPDEKGNLKIEETRQVKVCKSALGSVHEKPELNLQSAQDVISSSNGIDRAEKSEDVPKEGPEEALWKGLDAVGKEGQDSTLQEKTQPNLPSVQDVIASNIKQNPTEMTVPHVGLEDAFLKGSGIVTIEGLKSDVNTMQGETQSEYLVQEDVVSSGTGQNPTGSSVSVEGCGSRGALWEGSGSSAMERPGINDKRKLSATNFAQEENEDLKPEQINGLSCKKVRMDLVDGAADITASKTNGQAKGEDGNARKKVIKTNTIKSRGKGPGISLPSSLDILSGRGGGTNRHTGNLRFRAEARQLRELYQDKSTSNDIKFRLSQELVRRARDYGARFLVKCDDGLWYEMDDLDVRKKASQALRENKWGQGKDHTP